jgi:long-chain acyl-CoA synthetase
VKEQMIEWWGPVLYEYYAGTEGNGFCAIDSEQWMTHKGSVGRSLLGEIHILDDDGGELPPGEIGTVFFGKGADFEYHNDPEKTAASRSKEGYTTIGDVGYVDEEGFLHPKVADVAVIGVPNEEFGEEVKAVVQPMDMSDAGPALAQELLDFCRENLSHVKCPRSVDFEPELPRYPTGKLFKRLLKERYWKGHEGRII